MNIKDAKSASIENRKKIFLAIDSVARRGGITKDKAITAWYASEIIGIDEDEALDAASVDGPEDGGCDFIYVDHELDIIYVLQGYISDRPEKAPALKKWTALIGAISNIKDPIYFKHAGRIDIYERLKDLDLSSYGFVFGLIALAAKSDQISRHVESTIRSKTYGSNTNFIYEDQDTLYDKFLVSQAADRNVTEDNIAFSQKVIEQRGDFGQAIVGTVSASELIRLHNNYKNRLFEGNVRLFIGQRKGGINEKIVETAMMRPGDFWALNNGITIVADSFISSGENTYKIQRFSIVNGCQTTGSLAKAVENSADAANAMVLVRVVAARRSLLTDIVRYNNTQNPVKISAVRLLDPIQEELRIAFASIDYQYAPKQEGAKINKSPKRIELDRITQYLASMSDESILDAVAKKSELFDKPYKGIFHRGLKAEKVFLAWIIAQEVEREREILLDSVKDDATMRTVLGIMGTPWGIYVASTLINKSDSDLSKLTLKKMDSNEFRNSVKKYAAKAVELYSEIAINMLVDDGGELNIKNELRVKSFLDRLKRNLSVRLSKSQKPKLPKLDGVNTPN